MYVMAAEQDQVPMHVIVWAGEIQAILFDKMGSSFPHTANIEADGWAIHLAQSAGQCTASFRKLSAVKSDV